MKIIDLYPPFTDNIDYGFDRLAEDTSLIELYYDWCSVTSMNNVTDPVSVKLIINS